MDTETHYRVKHTLLLQVVRDILIENGLTTYDDFNKKYKDRVDEMIQSEAERAELKENMY